MQSIYIYNGPQRQSTPVGENRQFLFTGCVDGKLRPLMTLPWYLQ